MKILLVGDQHITGFGLSTGQVGFVGHFVRQISRTGQAVTIEAHPVPNLPAVGAVLTSQLLDSYDLIIWQSGAGCLEDPLAVLPNSSWATFRQWAGNCIRRAAGTLHDRQPTIASLRDVLSTLRNHRHKVLIMTPVPQPGRSVQWWREQGRQLLLREGYQQGFSVFDTSRQVRPTAEHFLLNNPTYLNAVSHELIGRALFDFYQATPTIVTIRSVRKN